MTPRLLVSVRNEAEALAALQGGADIIDVKEPDRGALGRADSAVIACIVTAVRSRSPGTLISAALGEIVDWNADEKEAEHRSMDFASPDLFKAGPAGLSRGTAGDWATAWRSMQCEWQCEPGSWVAVSYADFARCDAPAPERIVEAGERMGSPVLLLDTYEKDGSTLLDWVSADELRMLRERTRAAGMKLALAGRVSRENLDIVMSSEPDIVAVRGAVCADGDRHSAVSADLVRDLVRDLVK